MGISPFKIPRSGTNSDDSIGRAAQAQGSEEMESVILSNEEAPSSYDGGMTTDYSQITKDLDKEMR